MAERMKPYHFCEIESSNVNIKYFTIFISTYLKGDFLWIKRPYY